MKHAALLIVVFIVSATLAAAFARTGGGASKVDPYLLNPPKIGGVPNAVNNATSPVTLRTLQTVNPAVRNLILIGAGQSNMTNSPQAAPYSPVNTGAIDQISIDNSGIYNAADPLLGTSINNYPAIGGGNPLTRIADAEITAGNFDRVICASVAIDGTAVADWDPALNGVLANRIPVMLARLAAKGIVPGVNVTFAVLWGQGETDTGLFTPQSAYFNSLTNVINTSRAAAGSNILWLVAKQTYVGGMISVPVQNAQLAIINHGANIWAGPNADTMIGTSCGGVCRPDDLHFGDLGMPVYVGASIGWQAALHATGAPF